MWEVSTQLVLVPPLANATSFQTPVCTQQLRKAFDTCPDSAAVVEANGEGVTYGELDIQADCVAIRALRGLASPPVLVGLALCFP